MATPHANLPRGTRIKVAPPAPSNRFYSDHAEVDDAARTWSEPSDLPGQCRRQFPPGIPTNRIIAPSIKTEGKLFQTVQSVGMGSR